MSDFYIDFPSLLTQTAFALHLGKSWTQPKLNAIINGKRSITEDIALDFANALGTSAEFWMGLQAGINLWEAKQKRKKAPLLNFLFNILQSIT